MKGDKVGSACSMCDGQDKCRRYRGFGLGNLKKGIAIGRPCHRWEDNDERYFEEMRVETGLIWLRIRKISVCFYQGNKLLISLELGEILE
jgi:hypothetical protein